MSYQVAIIEITERCPLNCLGCYISKNPKDMKFSEFKEIINKLPKSIKRLELSGGETFLHPKLLDFCKYATNELIKPQIFTSGFLPEKDKIKELKPYINSIKVTIRSANPERDSFLRGKLNSFEKSVRTLEICKELGIPRYIHFVVDKESIKEMEDMEKLAKKYDAKLIKLPFLPHLNTPEIIERFDSEILANEYPLDLCPAGVLRFSVNVYGDVTPCVYIRENFGNLLKESFAEIKARMHNWRAEWGKCKNKCIAKEILMKKIKIPA